MAKEVRTQQPALPFDPVAIIRYVLRRWYVLLVAALAAFAAVYVLVNAVYQPKYTVSVTFSVSLRQSTDTAFEQLPAAGSLAFACAEVFNSPLLHGAVRQAIVPAAFDGTITAKAVAGTNLLTVRITDENQQMAYHAACTVVDRCREALPGLLAESAELRLLCPPALPAAPTEPFNAAKQAAGAALLSAAATALFLGLYHALGDRVRSAAEVHSKLDCRVLAALRHEGHGILTEHCPVSHGEAARFLRRSVEQHMPAGGVLLITSAAEGEGKSTAAVRLALALAQKQRRVLLLDGNSRAPACAALLGCPWSGGGVCAVVCGELAAENAVRPYAPGSTLDLLLEPRACCAPAELTTGAGMAALLAWARRHYDWVILDAPSLAVGPDAECLAGLSDSALLAVRQGQSQTEVLRRALATLRDTHAEVLGVVLNDCCTLSFGEAYGLRRC